MWIIVIISTIALVAALSNSKKDDKPAKATPNDLNQKRRFTAYEVEDVIRNARITGRDVEIEYQNYEGIRRKRRLSNIRYNNEFEGYFNMHIKAYCHFREEERTFRISRIISAKLI